MDKKILDPSTFDTRGIVMTMRILTAIKIIGKLILPIIAALGLMHTIFAVNDFLNGNIGFGILNSVLASFAALFVISVIRRRVASRKPA